MHHMIRVRKNKMAHFFGRSHQIPQPFFVPEAVAYKALKANMTPVSHKEQIARGGR